MQQALLQTRDAGTVELEQRLDDAALERCARVIAEIMVIAEVNFLEQRLSDAAAARVQIKRGHVCLGIHTRISDNSLSTSIGLAT